MFDLVHAICATRGGDQPRLSIGSRILCRDSCSEADQERDVHGVPDRRGICGRDRKNVDAVSL